MINLKRKSFFIFLILISFTLFFLYRQSNPTYLIYFKNNLVRKIQKELYSQNNDPDDICPEKISNLPKNSILIIGHAYGSHKKSELRGNVELLLKFMTLFKNRNKINSIIFSGDVLKNQVLK